MNSNKNNIIKIRKYIMTNLKKFTFILIILELIFLFSYLIPKVNFFLRPDLLSQKNINLIRVPQVPSPYQLVWWDVDGDKFNLNINVLNDETSLVLYGLNTDKSMKTLPIDSKNNKLTLNDKFSGSFNAVLKPFNSDFDNDGITDIINVSAKLDTLQTQGFVPVWTLFKKEQVQMEIFRVNEHTFQVMYNGKPLLNQQIQLISASGLNKKLLIGNDGLIRINNIRDFRSGIVVTYKDGNNLNIASYFLESRTLFTQKHFDAIFPLLVVLLISINIIVLIIIYLHNPFKKKLLLTEINNLPSSGKEQLYYYE